MVDVVSERSAVGVKCIRDSSEQGMSMRPLDFPAYDRAHGDLHPLNPDAERHNMPAKSSTDTLH